MNRIRGIVIATLLAVWCFPAVGAAKTPAAPAPWLEPTAAVPGVASATSADGSQATDLAARERRARELQDFRGGSGVYIYVGSGAVVVLLVILLVILLV